MQDVLSFILKNIVTLPEDVKVEETQEQDTTNFIVSVNPVDVGRVIGKEGKVIKAIRTIMRVIAIQKGIHIRISVLSENQDYSKESLPEVTDPDSITVEV